MVSVLTFIPLLPLLHNFSEFEVSIMDCAWCSFYACLSGLVYLLNLGNRPITELIILEKVLGLLANETKNLCSLGSVTYNCLKLPPVKLYILPLLDTMNGILSQIMTVLG